MVSEDFVTRFSERGAKFSTIFGVLVQKTGFSKGDGSHPLFFCYGGCWWMLALDYKKGWPKKTINEVFFGTPFWRGGKG